MCSSCSDARSAEQLAALEGGDDGAAEAVRSQAALPPTRAEMPASPDAEEARTLREALDAAEAAARGRRQRGTTPAAATATPDGDEPLCSTEVQQPRRSSSSKRVVEGADGTVEPCEQESDDSVYLAHDEERLNLGKPIWGEVAAQIPRLQHNGTLKMNESGAPVDLKALRREYPELPFIRPKAAAARAAKLINAAADGKWTPPLREAALSCFEAEAAGVVLALCMPEVVARDELMRDERYQVKKDGEVVGCKLFCPGCKSNEFVLMNGLNVESSTGVRFAYGNDKAIMPVSRG